LMMIFSCQREREIIVIDRQWSHMVDSGGGGGCCLAVVGLLRVVLLVCWMRTPR